MDRDAALARLGGHFDVLIIGGGATGLGATLDAAARGYKTALIEAEDFAKATSSRSTKLVHGGVRYLQAGDIGLVREALTERNRLCVNAPHLVGDLPFVLPIYRGVDVPYYWFGLKLYDGLTGHSTLAPSRLCSGPEVLRLVPGLHGRALRAGMLYHDGQFDDARLAVTLARTAVDQGAVVVNYMRAVRFLYEKEHLGGTIARDRETGQDVEIRAAVTVNATGIFADDTRALDGQRTPLLTHSRGSHVVVSRDIFGMTDHAVIVPKTSDGRVIFATPWHEHCIIGTTDIPTSQIELDPRPTQEEIEYLLATINPYLTRRIVIGDVQAAFAGLRPLIHRKVTTTAKQSREHLIDVAPSGLVTITGGKWTTYRKMAEDVVDEAARQGRLSHARSPTAAFTLRGRASSREMSDPLRVYGSDADDVLALCQQRPELRGLLHPRLPYLAAQVVYAARHEMARTVDDVLARRTRALFLDLDAARECAPAVAALLARELHRDVTWERTQVDTFMKIAERTTPA
jgi:glycerol-3-phosphate dehydrogenase